MLEDLVPLANGLGGLAALVVAGMMWPTVRSLKAIAERLDARLDDHGERLAHLEARRG